MKNLPRIAKQIRARVVAENRAKKQRPVGPSPKTKGAPRAKKR